MEWPQQLILICFPFPIGICLNHRVYIDLCKGKYIGLLEWRIKEVVRIHVLIVTLRQITSSIRMKLQANFIGKKIVALGERVLNNIPVVRVIYTSIKKVVDTVSLTETPTFEKMVLITYPREPLKTLGIVCCDTPEGITDGEKMLNVFVPTSPNPTTGFLFMLPEKETQPLKMSVEEGLKMIISFGMTHPDAAEEADSIKD